ncbi:MAG: tryptophan synthase subunit alpha [Candidatus Ratteibacteria bacterium]|nr:tryptophan synthase subunit alpha [Candidatus Ratteibacteria bacterium]
MNRIEKKWKELKRKGLKAFIAFVTAGDPSLQDTYKLVLEMEKQGADIIELGVPFSDPIADGPVIQASAQRALLKGVNLNKIFQLVKELRKKTDVPLVFLSYYNPIFHYGVKKFVEDAVRYGIDGVIVADLPPEEAKELKIFSSKKWLDTIFLAAPTSSKERLIKVAKESTGFIYCVSVAGVTGVRNSLAQTLKNRVQDIKRITKKPVAVGFGVSNTKTAKWVASFADGVIVGSAIVKVVKDNLNSKDLIGKIGRLVENLALSIHKV